MINPPIIIATHERSGTHMTIDLLRRQFIECRSKKQYFQTLDHLYLTLDSFIDGIIDRKRAMKILKKTTRPIIKSHRKPLLGIESGENKDLIEEILSKSKILYVVRDGRDVVCSFHAYRKVFDHNARCSLSEFIRSEVEGKSVVSRWAEHVRGWSKRDGVCVIRFEDIIKNTRKILSKIGVELNLKPLFHEPLLPNKFNHVWQARYARLFQQCPESTTIIGRRNGERPLKWKDAFSKEDRLFFHKEAADVLRNLGYISSGEWLSSEPASLK